ncbi:MAG: anthranilate synthase component I family protein [Candidatus Binatia bacterium]
MTTQEVELTLSPTALLTRCADQPGIVALDGGDGKSWGTGDAILGFRPRATLRVASNGEACMDDGKPHRWEGHPFELLDRFHAHWAPPAGAGARGAAVVAALNYDLRHWVERRPGLRRNEPAVPVLYAAFYDWLLWYSYFDRRFRLVSPQSPAALKDIAAKIERRGAAPEPCRKTSARPRTFSDVTKEQYLSTVAAALEYIAAGDVYQINLSQRFVVRDPPPPAAVFATLQRHTVPFGAYLDAGDFVLVSNSPECLLMRHGDTLATFPIKGTRPRGADRHSDHGLITELERSAKERAEHLMIVDLERNDLGRVCRTGSVRVEPFARVETFPSLHHLVSKISGQLPPGTPLAEVLRATFPGGSITGAPKVRAMEIIDELEPVGRGFYTGAIGYLGYDGNAVFNLAIRTAIATPGQLTYHAGGGIVADSIADCEYEETLLKARPFFAAVSAAAAP